MYIDTRTGDRLHVRRANWQQFPNRVCPCRWRWWCRFIHFCCVGSHPYP
ncbi:hypothetical protein [Lyngbya sp. CCY1209]|nr:hypothetical protein [Lyngbya sp. CCY1209]MEB3886154.1 hypothetical protein [Lyngbya sp. CCY1209]